MPISTQSVRQSLINCDLALEPVKAEPSGISQSNVANYPLPNLSCKPIPKGGKLPTQPFRGPGIPPALVVRHATWTNTTTGLGNTYLNGDLFLSSGSCLWK